MKWARCCWKPEHVCCLSARDHSSPALKGGAFWPHDGKGGLLGVNGMHEHLLRHTYAARKEHAIIGGSRREILTCPIWGAWCGGGQKIRRGPPPPPPPGPQRHWDIVHQGVGFF